MVMVRVIFHKDDAVQKYDLASTTTAGPSAVHIVQLRCDPCWNGLLSDTSERIKKKKHVPYICTECVLPCLKKTSNFIHFTTITHGYK